MEVVNLMKEEMNIGEKVIKRCPICYSPDIHVGEGRVYINHKEDELYIWEICENCNHQRRIPF